MRTTLLPKRTLVSLCGLRHLSPCTLTEVVLRQRNKLPRPWTLTSKPSRAFPPFWIYLFVFVSFQNCGKSRSRPSYVSFIPVPRALSLTNATPRPCCVWLPLTEPGLADSSGLVCFMLIVELPVGFSQRAGHHGLRLAHPSCRFLSVNCVEGAPHAFLHSVRCLQNTASQWLAVSNAVQGT